MVSAGGVDTLVTFLVAAGCVAAMYVIRNPARLARFAEPVRLQR